jgi:hypothetical protein
MATVLEVAQRAMDGMGLPYVSTLLGTGNSYINQVRALLYEEAEYLRNQRIFPQCKRKYSFDTENGRTQYPLPEDFYAALLRTQWDTTNRWELIGPLSDQSMTFRTYGFVSFEERFAYRIFGPDKNPVTAGGQFEVNPEPGTTPVTLYYEYITQNLFLPPNWTATTVVAATSYRNANGNIYYTSAGGTTGSTPPSGTTPAVDGTVTWVYVTAPYLTIRLDTDLNLFDDEVMRLGLQWRYLESKGLDYAAKRAEHDAIVDSAKARWLGNFSISLGVPDYRFPRPNVREGGWNY